MVKAAAQHPTNAPGSPSKEESSSLTSMRLLWRNHGFILLPSVWLCGFLSQSTGYHHLFSYDGRWCGWCESPLQAGCLVLLTCPPHLLSTSTLWHKTVKLILHFHCHGPGIHQHFSSELCFFFACRKWYLEAQIWTLDVLIVIWGLSILRWWN